MIEYDVNGKKKAINGLVDDETQGLLKKKGVIKKVHEFHIGDVVNFTSGISAREIKWSLPISVSYTIPHWMFL